jgi:alpha-tubulin suppressor-like RCC1 family protein
MFIKSDGSLWGMGLNNNGQLGDGTYGSPDGLHETNSPEMIVASNVTAVAAGEYHTLFLKNDRSLWGVGRKYNGELGDGTGGDPANSQTNRPQEILSNGVTAITAGSEFSFFIKNDGSLWATGGNHWGELGDGTHNSAYVPEQIVAPPPFGYNRITAQLLDDGGVRFSFVGLPGNSYALDRSLSLDSPVWVPQTTNTAAQDGLVVFTNSPALASINFWRVRATP